MPFTPTAPRIAYTIHGTSGPPVLLVMGLGMRGVVWRPQVEVLERDHRLLTFDNRGIGESDDAPGPWRIPDMAEDALRVLDAARFSSAHVVGVSMGGMIAQELALRAPRRVRSLTLIVTPPPGAGGPWGPEAPSGSPAQRGTQRGWAPGRSASSGAGTSPRTARTRR